MSSFGWVLLTFFAFDTLEAWPVFEKNEVFDFQKLGTPTSKNHVNVYTSIWSMGNSIEIICPRRKNGVPFDLLPNKVQTAAKNQIYAYAKVNGVYEKVNISAILHVEEALERVALKYRFGVTTLKLHYPRGKLLMKHNWDSFDLHCSAATYINTVSDSLDECLAGPEVGKDKHECPCTGCGRSSAPMLGIVRVKLTNVPRVLQGCGTFAVPLLMGGSESSADGKRSCTVDVMETPDIGFACSGHIEPARCPEQMYDSATDQLMSVPFKVDVTPTEYDGHMLLKMRYDRSTVREQFSGYCRCFDPSTDKTNAVITIKNQQEYVCDLSARLAEHMEKPIVGDWCDVVLQPESSVTIMFPVDDKESMELETPSGSASNRSLTPTRLSVETLSRVICNNALHYTTVTLESLGLASLVTVDDSLIDIGVVTIKYSVAESANEVTKPTSLYYKYQMDSPIKISDAYSITGTVKVTLNPEPVSNIQFIHDTFSSPANSSTAASSGEYALTLNRPPPKVYDFYSDNFQIVPVYCNTHEMLVPNDCTTLAFDASRRNVVPFPTGFRLPNNTLAANKSYIDVVGPDTEAVSLSCCCLDSQGIESSRYTFHHMIIRHLANDAIDGGAYGIISVPRVEMFKKKDEKLRLKIKEIPLTVSTGPCEEINVSIGDAVFRKCKFQMRPKQVQFGTLPRKKTVRGQPDHIGEGVTDDIERSTSTSMEDPALNNAVWMPFNDYNEFFNLVKLGETYSLSAMELGEVMIATGGFQISQEERVDANTVERSKLVIRYPKSAIVISKTGNTNIALHYACGAVSHATYVSTQSNDEDKNGSNAQNPIKEVRSMEVWEIVKVIIPTTDPYVHGCGVPSDAGNLFRPETEIVHNTEGRRIGCEVDLKYVRRAGFYCPLPYRTDPPNCRPVLGSHSVEMQRFSDITFSVSRSNNLFIFTQKRLGFVHKIASMWWNGTQSFQCHCVSITGRRLSTINIIPRDNITACI
ncbi:uncharacterized protein BcabD6B2_49660 [Babesia caballi]|uniref:Membrane protein, putative n=1 Tax=Babesia caballi TaxID=5871 RepID=A0AAV4M2B4_BABCB|nr:membrane protein, putative [Babesia caballi]